MEQTSVNEIERVLAEGKPALQGQFIPGSNYTFLVSILLGEQQVRAVYKPARGEQPLWDFPENTLALRETAAYVLSEALGLHLVPYTVFREDIELYGPGSLQLFVEHDPELHYFNFTDQQKQLLRPVVLFDLLVNNADRKGSHVLLEQSTGKLWAIDHGLCFHEEDKLRTVLWDFAGEAIPDDLLARVASLPALLAPRTELRRQLKLLLDTVEIEALVHRAEALLAEPHFPQYPQDRRAFPYPPI